jgi:hypothetical protein
MALNLGFLILLFNRSASNIYWIKISVTVSIQ